MGTRYATYSGAVTSRLIDYYVERAKGGVGLIIVQFAAVSVDGASSLYPLGIWNDAFVPGLRQLARAVQEAGSRVAIQLAHAGGQTSHAITGRPVVAPSAVPVIGYEIPRELTKEEIGSLVEAFGQAARRAMEAGFDAIEIHMAHGYLLNQFLSPLFNRRSDEYGGDLIGRARFPLEVLRRVREITQDRLPIFCRLNADDGVPGSLQPSEACKVAMMLTDAGAAVLDITAGTRESFALSVPSMADAPGALLPYAATIKAMVNVPVIAVGKIHDPCLAEEALAKGQADLIAIGRALIADPEWPNKAAEGRYQDIRPCLTCNRPECHGRTLRQLDMGCVVNAAVGREARFRLTPAPRPKRILVVGGGPAGLETARIAALRGHKVILCEEAASLGGQLILAAIPPHKEDIGRLTTYLSKQVLESGVDVCLNCRVTPELVAKISPDAVVLATGARPLMPDIPGTARHAVTAWDVLSGKATTGQRVVIIGGGDVGCETAEHLATQGKEVTIIEMLQDVATELAPWTRRLLLERLMAAKVEILTQTTVISVEPDCVVYDRQGLTGQVAPVDTVILACGAAPRRDLADALCDTGLPVHIVGDAARPRNLAAAIREGFELGFSL